MLQSNAGQFVEKPAVSGNKRIKNKQLLCTSNRIWNTLEHEVNSVNRIKCKGDSLPNFPKFP